MSAPLPPLPRFGDEWDSAPAGRSMVDILIDEHRQLRVLCADLDRLANRTRREPLSDVLTATIVRHLSAEAQYLYPTVRAVLPDGEPIADRELGADQEMLRTLRRLATTDVADPAYPPLVRVLRVRLARHTDQAARRILPRLRAVCSESDLVRLGNRIEIAQEAAPTRPHPGAPTKPPWNKVTEPALGVADKLRDAICRRVTYPADL